MELWVRTQDRFELAKINSVYAGYQEKDKDYVIMGQKHTGGARLGSYATKERALEVLDEIHQRLIDLQALEINANCYKTINRNIDCIYQMPKN